MVKQGSSKCWHDGRAIIATGHLSNTDELRLYYKNNLLSRGMQSPGMHSYLIC